MMNHLLDELAAAFPAHAMHVDAFHAPSGLWTEYEELEAFLGDIEGRSWDQLTLEFMQLHRFELGSMPARGFVAMLPAYLRACLVYDPEGSSLLIILLTDLTRQPEFLDQFDERIALMSAEQRLVTARVLAAALECKLHPSCLDRLENALDSYWRSLIEPDFLATPRERLSGGRFPLSEAYKQERDELLRALGRAFPAAPMHAAMFGDASGWWGEYDQVEVFTAEVSGRTWRELDNEFVERFDDALGRMEPAGFVAVLPAYLANFAMAGEFTSTKVIHLIGQLTRQARLREEDVRPFVEPDEYAAMRPESRRDLVDGDEAAMAVLTRLSRRSWMEEEFDARAARLAPEQCTVIARILYTTLQHKVYRSLEDNVQTAFDSYWRRFIDSPPPAS